MAGSPILDRIDALVDEEHRLWTEAQQGRLDDEGQGRLGAIRGELDRCWDLLRRRRVNPDAPDTVRTFLTRPTIWTDPIRSRRIWSTACTGTGRRRTQASHATFPSEREDRHDRREGPIYTAEAHVTGGRLEGHGRTSDGALEVDIRIPESLGGPGGGTNPEQLSPSGMPPASRARSTPWAGAASRRPVMWRSTRR